MFRILGPLELAGRHGPVVLSASRQSIIMSTLLLETNRIVSVDRLVDAVWPDEPPATARGQIQICISSLRGILTKHDLPGVINTKPPGYQIEVRDDAVDLLAFERLVATGRQASAAGRLPEAVDAYKQAVILWRGEPFAGSPSPILQAAATPLIERRLAAVEEYADLRMRLGQHQSIIGELVDLVERYPLRERLRAQLMLALFRSDRRADALDVYRQGRRILVDELGLEPGDQLRQIERAILSDDPELRLESGIVSVGMMTGQRTVPRMLPGALSDIAGHTEMTEAMQRHVLRRDGLGDRLSGPKVVAISGRGGAGKTTLATHVAHSLAGSFPDGQLFAHLHGAGPEPSAPAEVLGRFLRALGVAGNKVPEQIEERVDMFRSSVADQRLLVVLDDCADEEQVRWFMPATAGCALLVTSRHRLTGLSGAYQVEVDVLGLDHSLELLGNMLGAERLNAELKAATELVRLCGGLPLALRVAGARLAARPHWTIAHLVERLSDERRRLSELVYGGLDVRANLALSCRSLTPGAQRLFRRLGHLSASDFGGWICGPLMNTDTLTAIDLLDELVDARLVEVERGRGSSARFKLHDLIRAYSRELLDQEETGPEREQTIQRLVGSWLFLAERAHRAEYGGDHTLIHGDAQRWPLPEATVEAALADSLAWYDSERGGLVAAVRLAAASGLDEACWDLAMAAVTLFENRRYFQDWRVTHELALAATRASGNKRGTAAMLCSLGSLTAFEQRHAEAWPLLEEAAQLFRELGHDHGYALAIRSQAYLHRVQGDLDNALAVFEEALGLLQTAGDLAGEAHVLNNIAQIRLESGDAEAAATDLKLALAAAEETGARRVHAQVLCRLGDLQLAADEVTEAQRCFQRALDLVLVLHDRVGEATAKHGLAAVMIRLGRVAEAEAMLRSACSLAVHLGEAFVEARINLTIGQLHRDSGRLDQAHSALTRALELFERLHANALRDRTLALRQEVDALGGRGKLSQI